jgi:hypothetical protein
MNIGEIEASMDRGDYSSNEIYGLSGSLRADKNAKKAGYERLSEDDFERLDIVALLLSKLESVDPQNYTVGVGGDEWRRFGDVFSKLKRIIDSLEIEDIIDYVGFALGGSAHFHIVERQLYRDFLYNQIKAILRKVASASKEGATGKYVEDIEVQEDLIDLTDFQVFVERDGFKALWNNSQVGSELKNHPEENARAQFMAFLRGAGIYNKASQYKEVSEGAGFADVISIEQNGAKRLFELKVISDKHNRFQEGLVQLFEYISKERLKVGYYIVFDARSPLKRSEQYEKIYHQGEKTIHVILVDIHQIAPTKKFRMESESS